MHNLPVHIITGFLGAGKTTAILSLLKLNDREESWAVLVNEFGKISVDGQILREKSATAAVFDVYGGCICCSAREYLTDNIRKIIRANCFDRLLIEPSGLGGPDTVAESISAFPELQLMPVICVVDILQLKNSNMLQNMLFSAQIRKSGKIVFSKCDILEKTEESEKLIQKFKQDFPGKESYMESSEISLSLLTENRHSSFAQPTVIYLRPTKDAIYKETTFVIPKHYFIDISKVKTVLVEAPSIIRAKGYIHTKAGWFLINYTLSELSVKICDAPENSGLIIITKQENEFNELSATWKTEELIETITDYFVEDS